MFYDRDDSSCVVAYHVPYEYCSSPYPPLDEVVDEHVEYMELMASREARQREQLEKRALEEYHDVSSSYSMEFSYVLQDETNATSERSKASVEETTYNSTPEKDHCLPMASVYTSSGSADGPQAHCWFSQGNAAPLGDEALYTNEQKSFLAVDKCVLEYVSNVEPNEKSKHPFELDPAYDSEIYSLDSEYILELQKQEDAFQKVITGSNNADDGGSNEDGERATLRFQSQMLSPHVPSSDISDLKDQSLRIIEQLHEELTNDIIKIQQLHELNSQRLRLQLDNSIQQTRNQYDELHARARINTEFYRKQLCILFQR